jgi:molybdopterin-synthase adenylyltransferase
MSNRFSRQANYVNNRFLTKKFLVVGCGAVGKNIVLQLASMGCKNITVYDFDKIELHNCASQGWMESDVGQYKTEVMARIASAHYNKCKVTVHNKKWLPDFTFYDYIFVCADCMDCRQAVFAYYTNRIGPKPVIIDGRMRGEEIRIVTSFDNRSREHHKGQFFSNDEAADGNCTTQTTLYTSFNISSLAVQTAVAHCRKGLVWKDIICNLSNGMRVIG